MRQASEGADHRLSSNHMNRLLKVSLEHRQRSAYRKIILACVLIACSTSAVFFFRGQFNKNSLIKTTDPYVQDSRGFVDTRSHYSYFDFEMIDISDKRKRQRKSWSSFISKSRNINNSDKRYYKRYKSLKQQLRQLKHSMVKAI